MQIRSSSPIRTLYLKWRALRNVPFRKKFLVGMDLEENTFWEFVNLNNPGRTRRMVELLGSKKDYIDYKLPPQWSQWLRHVRKDPPSIEELESEQVRLATMKARVAAAQQKWAAIPLKEEAVAQGSVSPQGMPGTNSTIDPSRFAGVAGTKQAAAPKAKESRRPKKAEAEKESESETKTDDAFQPSAWHSKPVSRR
ncbi:hypothetical protein BZA70DRAFT_278056 [Myxozyma melibiosi]|uniref:NADH dehydrogenase [ubiquinone] 1 alpha subcomplex subunit n=1 Tax=Myxozyma melibiosi TaxID=54550 RepID=A0ABR1F6G5_9ASCO